MVELLLAREGCSFRKKNTPLSRSLPKKTDIHHNPGSLPLMREVSPQVTEGEIPLPKKTGLYPNNSA